MILIFDAMILNFDLDQKICDLLQLCAGERNRDGCESKKGAAEQRRNPELTRRFGGMRVGWGSQLQHVESFRGKIHAEENRLFNLTHFAIFTCGSEAVPQV